MTAASDAARDSLHNIAIVDPKPTVNEESYE
jgi:hypothetical protein